MRYARVIAVGQVMGSDVLPALVAVGILVGGTTGAAHNDSPARTPLDGLAYGMLVVAGLAFVLRRHLPLALLGLEAGVAGPYFALGYPYGPILPAVGLAAFFVAVRHRMVVAAAAGAAAAVVLAVGDAVGTSNTTVVGRLASAAQIGWLVIPVVIGALVRVARGARRDAAEQAQRRRIDEERLRLARDVHDVVGHGLSVISLQAGVALHILDRKPEQARVALEAIRRASNDALDELRATLALTRNEDRSARRTPVSGLDRLPGLVNEVRLCGLPVQVRTEGAERPLPAEVDQVAFRVVQESLTNVLRHADASRVDVTVHHQPDALRIVVDDDGSARPEVTPAARGHGLAGLSERAVELGGSCRAGPRPDGGWRVEAVLPLIRRPSDRVAVRP